MRHKLLVSSSGIHAAEASMQGGVGNVPVGDRVIGLIQVVHASGSRQPIRVCAA